VTRWAVRFGYDGRKYMGWARQPGLRTVEGTIRNGAVRCGIASTEESLRLLVSSRTDRGVSARANALVLSSRLPGEALLRALNGVAQDIFFTAATPVEETFSPRRALWRQYRYYEPSHDRHVATWRKAARLFEGDVDGGSFGRGLGGDAERFRAIERVRVRAMDGVFVVTVQARRFVWGMVRKIVAGIRAVDSGRLSFAQLEAAIRGKTRLTLPLAEPDRLVLWEARLPLRWRYDVAGWSRAQQRYLAAEYDEALVARAVLAALEAASPTPSQGRPRR
jgi:tRNA pseudouridine38-40 synthase